MGPKVEQNSVVEIENDEGRKEVDPESGNAGENAISTNTILTNKK